MTPPRSGAAAPFSLRPYQQQAIAAVIAARQRGRRRLVVCLPTGAGKTVIFSELARLARQPVLVLAHRSELVEQARDKLSRALGDAGLVAVEQADRRAHDGAKVVVASIRSLHENRLAGLMDGRRFGLIIYDECHHSAAEGNQAVLRALGAFDPDWSGTLLGFTATPQRADGKALADIFEEIVYSRSVLEMIDDGYLARLRGFRVATAADLRALSAGGEDFAVEELAEAVDIEERNALVARSIQELARDRRTVAFCVTVNHATHLARALGALGLRAGIVHGNLKREDRERVLADFRAGRLQAVTNVGVLTEGFDDPGISCIAMARPTRSEGLYAQCVGRGTRLHPGKTDCLVLDFVDLSDLSLVTLPTLVGLPRDFDLQGEDLREASAAMQRIWFDYPGFEIEAGAITLGEIQRRAAAFDPLTLRVDPEVRAVSAHAWESLGSRGLALHFFKNAKAAGRGSPNLALVLDHGGSGKRWRVSMDGREVARFSRLEDAVQAVDFEVRRMGRVAASSALASAAWRKEPTPAELAAELASLTPPLFARRWGEALRLRCHRQQGPAPRRVKSAPATGAIRG